MEPDIPQTAGFVTQPLFGGSGSAVPCESVQLHFRNALTYLLNVVCYCPTVETSVTGHSGGRGLDNGKCSCRTVVLQYIVLHL